MTTPADMTIGQAAEAVGLSRSTLLYYDRLGLLRPQRRARGDYRRYSPDEVARLHQIRCYRDAGVPLKQIARMLGRSTGEEKETVGILEHHWGYLEQQIRSLRDQQRQVLALLQQFTSHSAVREDEEVGIRRSRARSTGRKQCRTQQEYGEMIGKQRWIEIMRAAGLSDEAMQQWHRQFEKLEPEAHQEFLESLHIPADEIKKIREHSRK